MLKKDIELKQNVKIDSQFEIDENREYTNPLIQKISDLKIIGELKYHESIKTLSVSAVITCVVYGIDARDGKNISQSQKIEWIEDYLFEIQTGEPENNFVLGEEFDICEYAIEQIILNIPMNFTNNYDTIDFVGKDYKLFTEEDYQQEQESRLDPRWEQLDKIKFEDK